MAVYLGIHQVADPDERAGDADSDRDAVERPDVRHFVLTRKKPQTDEQTDGRAVAGQSSLMNVEDLDGMGQIVSRIVEQAMPESAPMIVDNTPYQKIESNSLSGYPSRLMMWLKMYALIPSARAHIRP